MSYASCIGICRMWRKVAQPQVIHVCNVVFQNHQWMVAGQHSNQDIWCTRLYLHVCMTAEFIVHQWHATGSVVDTICYNLQCTGIRFVCGHYCFSQIFFLTAAGTRDREAGTRPPLSPRAPYRSSAFFLNRRLFPTL